MDNVANYLATSSPEVSVVMAVRNEAKYISPAIESILSQQGLSFELIVIDDHSTDSTYEIIKGFADRDQRIRVIRNHRKGKVAAFNFGVSMANGHFICLFAGDDLMPDGSLLARWQVVREKPKDAQICALFKIRTLSDNPRINGQIIPRGKGRGNYSGQSPLMSRSLASRVFPVPEDLPNEDTWIYAALLSFPNVQIVCSDVICCLWRSHSGNSVSMFEGFEAFSQKIASRQRAFSLFLAKFEGELSTGATKQLSELIKLEDCRRQGDLLGVITARVNWSTKLRTLAMANRVLFGVRRRFYKLLSGW